MKALQCLLTERESLRRRDQRPLRRRPPRTAITAWQLSHDMPAKEYWGRKNWMSLLSAGDKPVLKFGSAGPVVRQLQRTLNAAGLPEPLLATGRFNADTVTGLRIWQQRVGTEVSGVAGRESWRLGLSAGAY